jgi:outer membrane protein assembly factor BamE (lipoprotein component of BamABCDE complex)
MRTSRRTLCAASGARVDPDVGHKKMKRNRKKIVLSAVLILTLTTIFAWGIFFCSSHAVPVEQFSQVKTGMTQDVVTKVIGNPLVIRHDMPNQTTYFYGGFKKGKWCTIEVLFDENGNASGTRHDH